MKPDWDSVITETRDLGTANRGAVYQTDCVGSRIRDRRRELKWTARKLAKNAGISAGFLSGVENSQRSIGASKLLDIARAMSVSLDYLMTGEEHQGRHTVGDINRTQPRQRQVPEALSQIASNLDISFKEAMLLMNLQQTIDRIGRKTTDPRKVDWQRLYEAIKPWLGHKEGI
jgi:transcriptional regulator with XRE-family HTH domain